MFNFFRFTLIGTTPTGRPHRMYKRSSTSPKLTFSKDLVSASGAKTSHHGAGSIARSVEHLNNNIDENDHNAQRSSSVSDLNNLTSTTPEEGSGCIVS